MILSISLESGKPFEFLDASLNIRAFDAGGSGEAEAFTAERRDDGAVDHRAADVVVNGALGGCQATDHAANEGIASAGRVHDLVQRISGANEETFRTREDRAVGAFFNHDVFRSELVDFLHRGEDVVF